MILWALEKLENENKNKIIKNKELWALVFSFQFSAISYQIILYLDSWWADRENLESIYYKLLVNMFNIYKLAIITFKTLPSIYILSLSHSKFIKGKYSNEKQCEISLDIICLYEYVVALS